MKILRAAVSRAWEPDLLKEENRSVKKHIFITVIASLWLVILLLQCSAAPVQAATSTPRLTPTIKACHICDEELLAEVTPAAQLANSTAAQQPQSKAIIYFFWGDGCPHCATEKPFLENLARQYSNVEVRAFEVWNSPENRELFYKVAASLGFEPRAVPTTILGERYWVGYNDQIGREIEAAVKACLASACRDAGQRIVTVGHPSPQPTTAQQVGGIATATPAVQSSHDIPPTTPPTVHPISEGFELAIGIMAGMIVALVYVGATFGQAWQIGRAPRAILPAWTDALTPVLTIIGLGVAGYLAYVETQAVPAACGPVGDCNAVQASSYAKLFGVLPVGLFGVFGYAAILIVWLWGHLRSDRLADYAPLGVLGMTVFGVLFSLYLTYLEPFVIKAVCAWCLTSAVIMTLLMLLALGPAVQSIEHE